MSFQSPSLSLSDLESDPLHLSEARKHQLRLLRDTTAIFTRETEIDVADGDEKTAEEQNRLKVDNFSI